MLANVPLIIVNPASANGKTGRNWPAMAATIRTHFGPFNVVFSEAAGQSVELASRAAIEGRALIIACGGDGTISEVANGIMQAGGKSELGILPGGTGSDFRRTLDIPSKLADAAQILRRGQSRRIDIGRVSFLNSKNKLTERYFVNLSSFGLSSHVIERSKESSGLMGGTVAYLAATVQETFAFDRPEVWLEIGDEPIQRARIINVCVANGRYFGGGMKVAPDAKLNDGLFDVVAIGNISTPEILARGFRLYTGSHLSMEKVVVKRAARIKAGSVHDGVTVRLEVDGEALGHLPATYELLPLALTVRCPA